MTRRLKDFFVDQTRTRRILALDGGAVRGMFALGALGELELQLRKRTKDPDFRLWQYFDLIGGTSTGSIIATGLALGMSVAQISALYKVALPKVFEKPKPKEWAFFSNEGQFHSGPLAEVLRSQFGEHTLASPELKTGLAIHCMRLDNGSPWVLVNNPGWKYYGDAEAPVGGREHKANKRYQLRDLVQASAAAPFFFRGRTLTVAVDQSGKKSVEDGYFVDGGVSGANNPALEMLMSVRDPAFGFEWPLGADRLYILSIGTGYARERELARTLEKKRNHDHLIKSLQSMISAVGQQQVAYMQALSRSEKRWHINGEKKDQPSAPYLTAEPQFDYLRVDVRIDAQEERDARKDEHANAFLPEKLTSTQIAGLSDFKNASDANVALLDQLGRAVGRRTFSAINPRPLFDADIRPRL